MWIASAGLPLRRKPTHSDNAAVAIKTIGRAHTPDVVRTIQKAPAGIRPAPRDRHSVDGPSAACSQVITSYIIVPYEWVSVNFAGRALADQKLPAREESVPQRGEHLRAVFELQLEFLDPLVESDHPVARGVLGSLEGPEFDQDAPGFA